MKFCTHRTWLLKTSHVFPWKSEPFQLAWYCGHKGMASCSPLARGTKMHRMSWQLDSFNGVSVDNCVGFFLGTTTLAESLVRLTPFGDTRGKRSFAAAPSIAATSHTDSKGCMSLSVSSPSMTTLALVSAASSFRLGGTKLPTAPKSSSMSSPKALANGSPMAPVKCTPVEPKMPTEQCCRNTNSNPPPLCGKAERFR